MLSYVRPSRVNCRPFVFSVCAALLASISPAAVAAPTVATIIIGGRTIPFGVTPYVGDDGQVYAPVDAVRLIGADYTVNSKDYRVTVTGANGAKVTVPYLPKEGHECVALQKVAAALGTSTDWQARTDTLTIRARLEMVRQNADSLSIYTSYPITYQVQHIDNPSRIYVDLFGLDLAAAPTSIPVVDQEGPGANVLRIRSGQINENTVRITIDLKHDIPFNVAGNTQTDRIRVALGTGGQSPTVVAEAPPETHPELVRPEPPHATPVATGSLLPLPITPSTVRTRPLPPSAVVANLPPPASPVVPPSEGIRITSVSVKSPEDGQTQIAITATGQTSYRTETLDDPKRLAFDLTGASLDAAVSPALPGSGPIIKAIRAGIFHSGVANFGRVVVDLSRLVGFSVSKKVAEDGSVTYLLNLQTPTERGVSPVVADGGQPNSLSGKIVVVDPGHGQQDSGALGADGTCEKTMTLEIGKKLRDVLVQNGATVFMTRADDSFLPVMARPQFAVAHGADYFISIHCDSSGRQNSHTGTTVYYHAQNGVCRRMAVDIVNRVAEVSGLPADGVKSDTIRFQTGFGVLRGSPMPAVLVECGYMNNNADLAKLKDDDTQQHIAEGIVAGLRDFIADRANH